MDGVGEWATTSAWIGNGNKIKPLWEISFPHSLGLLYSAFTYYCGFKVNSGEYKLMGLAPYGKPKYVETINQNSADIVFSDILFIKRSSKDNIIRTWKAGNFSKRKLKFGWMPPHPGVLVKSEIFRKFGRFDEKFKISGDYDFLLRVFSNYEGKIVYLNTVSVIMRYGGVSSRSYKNTFRKWKEDLIAIKQNNIGSILTVLFKRIIKLNQIL